MERDAACMLCNHKERLYRANWFNRKFSLSLSKYTTKTLYRLLMKTRTSGSLKVYNWDILEHLSQAFWNKTLILLNSLDYGIWILNLVSTFLVELHLDDVLKVLLLFGSKIYTNMPRKI